MMTKCVLCGPQVSLPVVPISFQKSGHQSSVCASCLPFQVFKVMCTISPLPFLCVTSDCPCGVTLEGFGPCSRRGLVAPSQGCAGKKAGFWGQAGLGVSPGGTGSLLEPGSSWYHEASGQQTDAAPGD